MKEQIFYYKTKDFLSVQLRIIADGSVCESSLFKRVLKEMNISDQISSIAHSKNRTKVEYYLALGRNVLVKCGFIIENHNRWVCTKFGHNSVHLTNDEIWKFHRKNILDNTDFSSYSNTITYFKVMNNEKVVVEIDINHTYNDDANIIDNFSILLSNNGGGKSFALSTLASFIGSSRSRKQSIFNKLKYTSYILLVETHSSDIYELSYREGEWSLKKNGFDEDLFKINEVIPSVLIITRLVDDKFEFLSESVGREIGYFYHGKKTSATSITVENSEINFLRKLASVYQNQRVPSLHNSLEYIGYMPQITIKICPHSIEDLEALNISRFVKKFKKMTNGNSHYNMNLYSGSVDSLNNRRIISIHENVLNYVLCFDNHDSNNEIDLNLSSNISNDLYSIINDLDNKTIDVNITFSKIRNTGKHDLVDYTYLSSGEKSILDTYLSINSSIEKNTVLLIDEPEISLHPKWQNEYIRTISSNIRSIGVRTQVLLATHSPNIVTNLPSSGSKILTVERDEYGLSFKPIPIVANAFSVEKILYEIFGVKSNRSYYIEQDLRIVIEFVDGSGDYRRDEALNALKRLSKIVVDLPQQDPLVILIDNLSGVVHEN